MLGQLTNTAHRLTPGRVAALCLTGPGSPVSGLGKDHQESGRRRG